MAVTRRRVLLERMVAVSAAVLLVAGLVLFFITHAVGEILMLLGVMCSLVRGLLERTRLRDRRRARLARERVYAEAHPPGKHWL